MTSVDELLAKLTAGLSPEQSARLVEQEEREQAARTRRADAGRRGPIREGKLRKAERALAQAARALRALADEPYCLAVAGAIDRVAADARRAGRGRQPRDVRVRGRRRPERREQARPPVQQMLPFSPLPG